METFRFATLYFSFFISIPLRYNLECRQDILQKRNTHISIPLRYNLEIVGIGAEPTEADFNSTKVQFGVFQSLREHRASLISIPLRYNLEKTTFEIGDLIPFSISIPLRYNLESCEV